MAYERFLATSWGFLFVLTFLFGQFPGIMTQATGVQTSDFSGTNITGVNNDVSNITDESQSQIDAIYNVYTNPSTNNRILQAIFLLFLLISGVLILDLGWIG